MATAGGCSFLLTFAPSRDGLEVGVSSEGSRVRGECMSVLTEEVALLGYGSDVVHGMLARPDDNNVRHGIIVLSDAFGLSEHFRDIARRFAQDGYTALALAIFSRSGRPEARPVLADLPTVASLLDRLFGAQVLGYL